MARKIFVEVIAKFDLEGNITPVSFVWEDGRTFEIDKVTDSRRAASLKAGGQGQRYTCMVQGKQTYLFMEFDNRWFIEGKE
jgi:hypothetical protein